MKAVEGSLQCSPRPQSAQEHRDPSSRCPFSKQAAPQPPVVPTIPTGTPERCLRCAGSHPKTRADGSFSHRDRHGVPSGAWGQPCRAPLGSEGGDSWAPSEEGPADVQPARPPLEEQPCPHQGKLRHREIWGGQAPGELSARQACGPRATAQLNGALQEPHPMRRGGGRHSSSLGPPPHCTLGLHIPSGSWNHSYWQGRQGVVQG